MNRNNSSTQAPLSGMRVIEFCNVAAGPFCGMLLADMGAEVVKIESPDGDTLRQWPPFNGGFSENFVSLNRNKQSIALNLKEPEDNAVARRLIESANIVIENNRPGAMARLGLDYERFADDFPGLIYCSMSAFGQEGPRAAEGGFDLTVQALSGIMSVTGPADGDPVKCGVPISDFATGLYAAFAVAALARRVASGGKGGYVDISMLGASLAVGALQTSEFFGSGRDPRRLGAAHPRNAPYQAFRAKDGDFVMAAGNDRLWRSVCEIVARPELVEDPRFLSTTDRAANQGVLETLLNDIFMDGTVDDWLGRFERAGVPCGRINRYSEALADPQVAHMGWVREVELPGGQVTRTFASPLRIDGESLPIYRAPPALGADREHIISALSANGMRRRA